MRPADDTIVALASGRGKAGVAVIRVSGPLAWDVCAALAGDVPQPRKASLRRLVDQHGQFLDEGLVLTFSEGQSFTGEQSCELQVHGGIAVVTAVLRACLDVDGVRTAEPGEFTKRAFMAGRLTLPDVEALADLIDAETEGQRRQAQAILDGTAGRLIEELRQDLLLCRSMIEATLDFSDEELPTDMESLIRAPMVRVRETVEAQLRGRKSAEIVREGFEIAIIGRVNAGKSSLMNRLAGREAAITSDVEGTTRDIVEVRMDIGGFPVILLDTAGMREAVDTVEQIGIERGLQRAKAAHLRIYLKSTVDDEPQGLQPGDLVILSKRDLHGGEGISSLTGEGIEELLALIEEKLSQQVSVSSVFSRERHFDMLARCRDSVVEAESILGKGIHTWDLAAENLRSASMAVEALAGKIDSEDVLGAIFGSFCIGK
ncbi:MAG: tRNA uridine-5-carboxymethylaminomethyl(34) synthesis GTPase MnmE [Paracoccaceae bacterium]